MRYNICFVGFYLECPVKKVKRNIYKKICCGQKYLWPSEKFCPSCGRELKNIKVGTYKSISQENIDFCNKMKTKYDICNIDQNINEGLKYDYWCIDGVFFENSWEDKIFEKDFPVNVLDKTHDLIIEEFKKFYGYVSVKHGFLEFLKNR